MSGACGESAASAVAVPGKLMIAGEYSVLSPGGVALSVAVEMGMHVAASAADRDTASSEALGLHEVPSGGDSRLFFVEQALDVTRRALEVATPLHLEVRGLPPASSGHKVGLGTSAAVTVGTVAAVWRRLTGEPAPSEFLFRLGHLAHSRAQGKLGSGYDIATIARGVSAPPGCSSGLALAYSPPAPERCAAPHAGTARWLTEPWDELRLEPLPTVDGLYAVAVFSGGSADTRELVRATARARGLPELEHMRDAAVAAVDAWRGGDAGAVVRAVDAAERALELWDERGRCELFPAASRRVREEVANCGAIPRTSGAGGGDSLIAFADAPEPVARVQRWAREGGYLCFPLLPPL